MTKALEAVARAIYAEFENRPDYAQHQMNGLLAQELARAALFALLPLGREVGSIMSEVWESSPPDELGDVVMSDAFTAAINHILGENHE